MYQTTYLREYIMQDREEKKNPYPQSYLRWYRINKKAYYGRKITHNASSRLQIQLLIFKHLLHE